MLFIATAQPPLSPFLKPLPAPPVDEEVQALENQVSCSSPVLLTLSKYDSKLLPSMSQVAAACQRVAELRATVPGQLAEHLSQHLQQCRPSNDTAAEQPAAANTSADALDVGGLPSQGEAAQPDAALGSFKLQPAPAELQTIYSAAVQKMPALR